MVRSRTVYLPIVSPTVIGSRPRTLMDCLNSPTAPRRCCYVALRAPSFASSFSFAPSISAARSLPWALYHASTISRSLSCFSGVSSASIRRFVSTNRYPPSKSYFLSRSTSVCRARVSARGCSRPGTRLSRAGVRVAPPDAADGPRGSPFHSRRSVLVLADS